MEYNNILKETRQDFIQRVIKDTQGLLRRETEDYLRAITVEGYPQRQKEFWKRDYNSLEKFEASVEPNRKRWQDAIGDFKPEGEMELYEEPFLEDEYMEAKWLSIKFSHGLRCRAVLSLPKKAPRPLPLVVCQHGVICSPEKVFGFADDGNHANLYHAYGYELAKNGFAVLAPLHITETAPRGRYHRMSILLGKTIYGLEISKLKRLLDYVETLPEIDSKRIGMWGISQGGNYTLFTLPVEKRIKVGIICAFFNHRLGKMVIDDPRYSCFLSTPEEHVFVPGWLREFTDSDLISLFVPRPLLIQTGKADSISWWPLVLEEFNAAKSHYSKLGLGDRIAIDLHEGGHEIRVKSGVEFLKKWLKG